ncbi:MAG: NADH-quinone oxidoreductase subunit H [Candidatus Bathyarchaeia archaeon]
MILEILEAIIFPGALYTIGMGFLFDWLDRKTSARMQGRIGPMIAGPYGTLQPLADFLKLLFKEEIIPSHADKLVFLFAPALFFMAPILSMLFIPIIGPTSIAGFQFDILAILFLLGFSAFVVSILSFSSASSFTTVATGRLVLQYVSYEIPLVLSIIAAALCSRSLSVEGVVGAQTRIWNVFFAPIAFCVFIVAMMAELEKAPFDIPSAKTEIVGGWLTEFSGRALAFLKLTKEVSYVFGCALAVSLFLGGPLGPILNFGVPVSILYFIYFTVKILGVGFVIFVLKTSLTRIKIGQATQLFWKILTPLSLCQILLILILIQGGLIVAT